LMTWNREKWNAWDFPQILADVNNGKSYSLRWRTANSHVKAGDRIFIMRLGKKEPRGIFASGVALGSPTFGKPVDDEFPHQRYVPIKITTLIDPAVRTLGWETLKAKVSASFKWTPEGSGIEIPPEVASKLDLLWERFTSSRPRPEIELGGVYSWKQIVEQFQANQTFLSQKDGKIVCATIDPDKNQLFPDALFVGTKERNIELANTLHGQIEPFPMFEKKGTNKWSFVGYFRFRQQVFDGHIFEEAKHLSPRPISSVVFLDPESDSHESAIDMYGEQVAIEGKKRLITHYRRERNRAIVKLKKEHVLRTTGKLQCEACDFDSKNFYGNHVPDFCDAHHNNPLAEARDDGTNTTLDDLSIICPNCHRAIHLLDPMPSVADFRRHKQ